MNVSDVRKRFGRLVRKLALLCLVYAVGFVSAIYWAVSPGPNEASAESSPYSPAAVSISRAVHKSVDYTRAAAEKAGDLVAGDSEEAKSPEK